MVPLYKSMRYGTNGILPISNVHRIIIKFLLTYIPMRTNLNQALTLQCNQDTGLNGPRHHQSISEAGPKKLTSLSTDQFQSQTRRETCTRQNLQFQSANFRFVRSCTASSLTKTFAKMALPVFRAPVNYEQQSGKTGIQILEQC